MNEHKVIDLAGLTAYHAKNRDALGALQTAAGTAQSTATAAQTAAGVAQSAADAAQSDIDAHTADTVVHITAAERTAWNAKQGTLTFDDVPTENSTNPVTSGGVYTAVDDLQTQIDNINGVEFHICTSGEYDSSTGQPTVENPSPSVFYLAPTGTSPDMFTEWVYVNSAWEQFGSAQVDLTNYVTSSQLTTALNGKQDVLTFDVTPTAGSNNPVTSDGISAALGAKQDVLTFDNAPTASSSNPVKSGGVYTALAAINQLPSGGSAGQVLTKTASSSAWANAPKELPSGGAAGQVLAKASSTDYDTQWINQSSGGGGISYAAIGTVIYHAGKTAPGGYLVCDGKTYNIADYPDLAAFFATEYGKNNYWGGNGTTTFAVPNWQGEFFRAAGSNSHSNQGSGGAVGEHQNGTQHVNLYAENNAYITVGGTSLYYTLYADNVISETTGYMHVNKTSSTPNVTSNSFYTSRPTNTSLLVCIKALAIDNKADIVADVLAAIQNGEEMRF